MKAQFQSFREKYLLKFWSPFPAIIALGVLAAFYFGLTGTYWAVTGEFTRWGGEILESLGVDVSGWGYFKIIGLGGNILTRVDGVMIIGMFAGALIAALMANNVKLRLPQSNKRVFQALIGGAIAGFGARLGMGCNLASFFTGIPQFSLHAWFFTLMSVVGVYVGAKVVTLKFFSSDMKMEKVSAQKDLSRFKGTQKSFFALGVVVFLLFVGWIAYLLLSAPVPDGKRIALLPIASICGLGFGFIISRAQVCFTSAFRDLFITGRGYMARAVVVGMAVSTIGVFSYIMLGLPPKIMWAGPNVIIGGFLFGFGIVIAGGCECGWMYRAVEGQVHYWIVGVGNVIGSTILAASWDSFAETLVFAYPKVNLLDVFGDYGGLAVNLALLLVAFLGVLYIENRTLAKRKQKLM